MFCVWAAEGEDHLREGWAAQAERVMLRAGDKATTKEPREKGETHLWVNRWPLRPGLPPKSRNAARTGGTGQAGHCPLNGSRLSTERSTLRHRKVKGVLQGMEICLWSSGKGLSSVWTLRDRALGPCSEPRGQFYFGGHERCHLFVSAQEGVKMNLQAFLFKNHIPFFPHPPSS